MNFGSGLTMPLIIGYSLLDYSRFKRNIIWCTLFIIKNYIIKAFKQSTDKGKLEYQIAKGSIISLLKNYIEIKQSISNINEFANKIKDFQTKKNST